MFPVDWICTPHAQIPQQYIITAAIGLTVARLDRDLSEVGIFPKGLVTPADLHRQRTQVDHSYKIFRAFDGSGRGRVIRPDPRELKISRPDPSRPVIFQTPIDPTSLDPGYLDNLLT